MVGTPLEQTAMVAPEGASTQYQSLYRRYRPQRFSEVRGQDLVVTTLRNAVRDDRVVHAYLFSGPRGTGKTSTARILAKALNCTNPQDGEPCGECESCLDIARGASMDVHELDAASNNGVDAMRDLVARASLASPGKRKVYIIDEVHMLSTAASNALLKTLEEPPEHVVFVLATTDPQKVLPTIRSRTQHFEFHLLEAHVLEELLAEISADAGLQLPEDGIDSAVRRGHGSARDALSVLDQVAASGVVADDAGHVRRIIATMADQDVRTALRLTAEAVAAGIDAQRLTIELVEALREQFLMSVASRVVPAEAEGRGADGRAVLPPARCVRALELLGKALVDMREAIDPRTTLEVALVRLTNPDVDDSTSALLDRVERLERRVAELSQGGGAAPQAVAPEPPPAAAPAQSSGSKPALGAFRNARPPAAGEAAGPGAATRAAGSGGPAPAPPSPAPPSPAPAASPAAEAPSASGSMPTRDDLVTAWADSILPRLRPRAKAIYAVGRFVSVEGDEAVLALPNAAHVMHAEALRTELIAALSAHFGTRVGLRLVPEGDHPGGPGAAASDAEGQTGDVGARSRPARVRSSSPDATGSDGPPPGVGVASDDSDFEAIETSGAEASGPKDSASWAEHRVREVFPGAEEVSG